MLDSQQKKISSQFTKAVVRTTQSTGDACTLLKKRHWYKCFPVNFEKFLRTDFFYKIPQVTASGFNIENYLHDYLRQNYLRCVNLTDESLQKERI